VKSEKLSGLTIPITSQTKLNTTSVFLVFLSKNIGLRTEKLNDGTQLIFNGHKLIFYKLPTQFIETNFSLYLLTKTNHEKYSSTYNTCLVLLQF
jgi:hypothetical protein